MRFYTLGPDFNSGITTFIWIMGATFLDALYTIILAALFSKSIFLINRLWMSIPIGFVSAFVVERVALAAHWWSYNAHMPMLPILGIGLTPTLQLGILSYIVFELTALDQ